MKLSDLAPVLRSVRCGIQCAIVYDISLDRDIEDGCSVEYAVANYGDYTLERISAEEGDIVLHVRKED